MSRVEIREALGLGTEGTRQRGNPDRGAAGTLTGEADSQR